MKTIKKDELYRSLDGFLKTKGIELKDGAYTKRINRACDLLTDAINETQKTVKRAKVKVDEKLDLLRHSIHEATAPKPPPVSTPKPPTARANKEKNKPSQKRSTASKKAR